MRYTKAFFKTVWGYFEVEANSEEEAEQKFEDGEYDEIDNKSEYDHFGERWRQDG